MRNFILICFAALVATGCMSFFILFEGNFGLVKQWWEDFARESETLPFAPYKSRVVSKSDIRTEAANELIILDQNLFWRGSGAIVTPLLNSDNTVKKFVVKDGGRGYSSLVKAYVSGAGGQNFEISPLIVKGGSIISVPIKKTAKWNNEPRVYVFDEKVPFSGITEKSIPKGSSLSKRRTSQVKFTEP